MEAQQEAGADRGIRPKPASRRARTSFTTCFQPSRSANQPNPRRGSGAAAVDPGGRGPRRRSRAPPGSGRRSHTGPMCPEMPCTSCTILRAAPSGATQAAATVDPIAEGKVNSV